MFQKHSEFCIFGQTKLLACRNRGSRL